MEYASAVGGMCLGELANTYVAVENRIEATATTLRQEINTMDVRMDEIDEGMRDFDMRVSEVEERVGAAERTHDAFEAFVNGFHPRVGALEWQVRDLQEQVGRLMAWRAVVQHGRDNPIVVDDDEEELVEPVVVAGPAGRLVPIDDLEIVEETDDEGEEEGEPDAEEEARQIVLDGGAAPEYVEEEVPAYEEAPEYQIPPIVE